MKVCRIDRAVWAKIQAVLFTFGRFCDIIKAIRKLIDKLEFDEVEMLGKIVKVIVDRPLGTYHPKHKDIYYSVNYGYIEGIIAADGEEQDAYILGVNEPIKEFNGKVIAVIHRFNDIEEKWVVAPEGASFTKDEIMQQVDFQEQFFKTEIRM